MLVTDALTETAHTSAELRDMATAQLADHAMASAQPDDSSNDVVHQLAAFAQSVS